MDVKGLAHLLISLSIYALLWKYLLLVFLANEIVRGLVSIILRVRYNGKIKIVPDGVDAIWPPGRSMAVVVSRTDKYLAKDKLIAGVLANILLVKKKESDEYVYQKLKQMQVRKLGYACWMTDEKFDVENHFRTVEDKVYYKSDLGCIVRELGKDMGKEKPQWEVIIVPRYQEAGELHTTSVIIFRFHHSYMDGISIQMMINRMCSNFNYYIDPRETFVSPTLWETLLDYTQIFISFPFITFTSFSNKLKSFWPKRPSDNTNSSASRNYAWSKSIELESIREIRKTIKNATIPVIIGNAFITATKQVLPFERYPEQWYVAELAAILPYKHSSPQNRFSGFPYNINSSIKNELTRLQTSTNDASIAAQGPLNISHFVIGKILGRFPMFIAQKTLVGESTAFITSYLPGSVTKVKLLDSVDILELWVFPPHGTNTGIFLSCNMYCNNFKVVASAETSCLEENELKEIVSRIPKIICSWCSQSDNKTK